MYSFYLKAFKRKLGQSSRTFLVVCSAAEVRPTHFLGKVRVVTSLLDKVCVRMSQNPGQTCVQSGPMRHQQILKGRLQFRKSKRTLSPSSAFANAIYFEPGNSRLLRNCWKRLSLACQLASFRRNWISTDCVNSEIVRQIAGLQCAADLFEQELTRPRIHASQILTWMGRWSARMTNKIPQNFEFGARHSKYAAQANITFRNNHPSVR